MSIFDVIIAKPLVSEFRPANVEDLIALRLAQKLGEPAAAAHYARLIAEYSPEQLSLAYRKSVNGKNQDVARRFHLELELLGKQRSQRPDEQLLAIKVERRAIAVAVFVNSRLDFHDTRTLLAHEQKAEASAIGFLNWVLDTFVIQSATLEQMPNGDEIRRTVLNRAVLEFLRAKGIPVWEVNKTELLAAYGYPPVRTRDQLRRTAQTVLWAMLNTNQPESHELDAAALGLHVQTERLFLY